MALLFCPAGHLQQHAGALAVTLVACLCTAAGVLPAAPARRGTRPPNPPSAGPPPSTAPAPWTQCASGRWSCVLPSARRRLSTSAGRLGARQVWRDSDAGRPACLYQLAGVRRSGGATQLLVRVLSSEPLSTPQSCPFSDRIAGCACRPQPAGGVHPAGAQRLDAGHWSVEPCPAPRGARAGGCSGSADAHTAAPGEHQLAGWSAQCAFGCNFAARQGA